MKNTKTTDSPVQPSIEPSQAEVEQRILDNLENILSNNQIRFSKDAFKKHSDELFEIEVDKNGFLRDPSGEYYKPYSFSKEEFAETGNYFRPSKEVLKNFEKEKIHIDDVYGFYNKRGETIIILDNWCNIIDMFEIAQTDIKFKTSWSETEDFISKI